MRWTVQFFDATVLAEIEALPPDRRSRLSRLLSLIQDMGFEALPRDAVKHLEGKLWELRVMDREGIARAIYATATGRRVVILRAFVKKTQKTPARELDIARRRLREVR